MKEYTIQVREDQLALIRGLLNIQESTFIDLQKNHESLDFSADIKLTNETQQRADNAKEL